MKRGIVLALFLLALLGIGPALVKAGESGLPAAQPPLQLIGTFLGMLADKPHGPYMSTTDKCAVCHKSHSAGYSGLLTQPNSEVSQAEICTQCHGAGGALEVSTHSNKDYAGAEQAPFYLLCSDCHDPHSSSNKALVKTSISIQNRPDVTATVVFKSTTGTDSYDDGYGDGQHDSICAVCHVNTAHNNQKSTDLLGQGHNPVGGNCISCHSHGKSLTQRTGFMPADGACVTCHKMAQLPRRQIVDSAGDGTGAGGDFVRASHHVQPTTGTVKSRDCIVCHDVLAHKSGVVRLKDPDNPDISVPFSDGASLEPFCLNCHDANGANGIITPFSDGKMPADIKGTNAWTSSAHKAQAGKTCFDCHNNGHGSNLEKGLTPYNGTPGIANINQEEGFCYTCHSESNGTPDVQSQFALASHHQVDGIEQAISNARVECTNCHNPHVSTSTQPLIDPDQRAIIWSGSERDFCLRCHDGAPPAGVAFPPTAPGTGWDKSSFAGSRHDSAISGDKCLACHERHGSGEYSLLRGTYAKSDDIAYAYLDGNYGLCFSCHVEARVVVTGTTNLAAVNAFATEHQRHVQTQRSPCIHCHDAHSPSDAGEEGLINFFFGVTRMDARLEVGSGTFDFESSFRIEEGNVSGSCYITCHSSPLSAIEHDPKQYARSPVVTTEPSPFLIPLPVRVPTVTVTPTATWTVTPVATATPTATPTGTVTVTATPLPTPTVAVTVTQSPTPQATPGPTPGYTPSPVPTATSTLTSTPTATAGPTMSPVPTESATPGIMPTPSHTPTQTPNPTAGSSPTAVPTLTPSPADSPTPSPTPARAL